MTFYDENRRREEQLKAEIARLRSALRVVRATLANCEDEIFINLTISPENEE